MNLPWYKEGLRFGCTGCGKCCTGGPGYVWVSEEEIALLAKELQMDEEEFRTHYVRQVGRRFSLLEVKRGEQFDCIFLEGKMCKVYNARPKQCRTYPFWPENLSSRQAWEQAAKECEGINHPEAALHSQEEIDFS